MYHTIGSVFPGTLAFGGDSAGGTAEVEVDFGVAHLPQLADHPGGQCAVFGQQLGDDRRTGVRCRVHWQFRFRQFR